MLKCSPEYELGWYMIKTFKKPFISLIYNDNLKK